MIMTPERRKLFEVVTWQTYLEEFPQGLKTGDVRSFGLFEGYSASVGVSERGSLYFMVVKNLKKIHEFWR